MKFLLVVSLAESPISFRGSLIAALQARVLTCMPPLQRRGANPLADFESLLSSTKLRCGESAGHLESTKSTLLYE